MCSLNYKMTVQTRAGLGIRLVKDDGTFFIVQSL